MNWTTKKPRIPGYYWMKPRSRKQIVKITYSKLYGLLVQSFADEYLTWTNLEVFPKSYQWAGPIEEPE